jgi:hypothetical protein
MTRKSFLMGFVAIFFISAGCAGPTRLAMDYGNSHKLSTLNQTLNAEAEKNLEPVMGLDGQAAQATMERYREGFEKAAPPSITYAPTFVIKGTSTGMGAGSR